MAKTKNKNDIKLTNIKRNNVVLKTGAKTTKVSKKPSKPKKKLEIEDEIKKEEVKDTKVVKKPRKKNTTIKQVEKKELTQDEIIAQKKERNRKKYQNQQKKYQESKKPKEKKKIVLDDQVEEEKKDKEEKKEVKKEIEVVKEEDLVKKELKKDNERKEKRKTNRKAIQFTQTITNIKTKSVTTIHVVKEKVDDKHIPVGKTIEEKTKRSKRLIKESIAFAIILTIINVICILVFDYFNFLRLFDIKALNVIITILISLIFNFFVAFMIDYFITEIWVKKKRKKDGEQGGDNRTIEGEYREDIENKEGK